MTVISQAPTSSEISDPASTPVGVILTDQQVSADVHLCSLIVELTLGVHGPPSEKFACDINYGEGEMTRQNNAIRSVNDLMIRTLVILGLVILGGSSIGSANAAEIWLSGNDPVAKPNSGTDFQALFSADARWSKAASKIHVFKVSTQLVMSGSDALLSRMFADLKRRNIGLAVEALILSEGPNQCGRGFEGYSASRTMQVMAERIRKLGGDLRYVAMDEPLWYGHHYDKKNACQSSYEDLARDVAQKVVMLRAVFPDVKIGDIEPLGSSGDWTNEIIQWAQAYRAAVGQPLSFVDADINWSGPAWHQQLTALAKGLRGTGVALVSRLANLD